MSDRPLSEAMWKAHHALIIAGIRVEEISLHADTYLRLAFEVLPEARRPRPGTRQYVVLVQSPVYWTVATGTDPVTVTASVFLTPEEEESLYLGSLRVRNAGDPRRG